MSGWLRWTLGLGLTIALLLALVVGLFVVLTRMMASGVPATATVRQQPTPSPLVADRLERKLEEFARVLKEGGDEPIPLIVTEEELTAKLLEALEENPEAPPLTNPQIRLLPDRLLVVATASPGGRPMDLMVTFRLRIEDGEVDSGVERASLGGLPLPAAGIQQILGGLPGLLGMLAGGEGLSPREISGMPKGLKTLRIEEGQMLTELIPSQFREAIGP